MALENTQVIGNDINKGFDHIFFTYSVSKMCKNMLSIVNNTHVFTIKIVS